MHNKGKGSTHCKNRYVMRHFSVKITLKFVISARKFVTLMRTENDASQMTYFSVSMTILFFSVHVPHRIFYLKYYSHLSNNL